MRQTPHRSGRERSPWATENTESTETAVRPLKPILAKCNSSNGDNNCISQFNANGFAAQVAACFHAVILAVNSFASAPQVICDSERQCTAKAVGIQHGSVG